MACEPVTIVMRDCIKLSGMLYFPETKSRPRLTVLKSDPYRETGDVNNNPEPLFRNLGHNYLYVSVRGTGNSTGSTETEYSVQEQKDMLEVIEFIIQQPWSNGKICLYGKSYSACNALHTLSSLYDDYSCDERLRLKFKLQKAVVCAFLLHTSYNNYENDVHWNGGVHPISDSLQYNFAMVACNMLPRIETSTSTLKFDKRLTDSPWIANGWLGKKSWWQSNTLILKKIKIPVFIYGGFHDLYCESAFKLHKKLPWNITVVSNQGHEKPTNLEKIFAWWETVYPTLTSKSLFCKMGTKYIKVMDSLEPVLTRDIIKQKLENRINIGPFFRLSPSEIQLDKNNGKIVWTVDNTKGDYIDDVICGIPSVNVTVIDPPKDFYLVAWVFDMDNNLLSLGTKRHLTASCASTRIEISLSPLCTMKRKFSIVLTMSCVPMLVPQAWNSHLLIYSASCHFPRVNYNSVVDSFFPMEKSKELNKYSVKSCFDKGIYTVSSIEKNEDYEEYFNLETSIKDTKFRFKEIYRFPGGFIEVVCSFSMTDHTGDYKILRRVCFSKTEINFAPMNLTFKL